MKRYFYSLALGLVSLSWASDALESQPSRYKTFSESAVRQCSIMKIHNPSFNICLDGKASASDLERAQSWAARASLTWLRALKVMDERVTRTILFTCKEPHLTIHLRPGSGTSHASPSVTTIYLTRPYGTWTHELGHALAGLSDTYLGTSAGSCGSQPPSLMCWGAYGPRANPEEWSTLWTDDIQAIQHNFKKVFSGAANPPSWSNSVNLEAPLFLNEPWPTRLEEDVYLENHEVELLRGPASEID
ncbi:MAG: hypothetical protein EB078_08095, partial [Proteobacteria bacterium]|nr:hypothetical protein [Pseudomonadota bacterium]